MAIHGAPIDRLSSKDLQLIALLAEGRGRAENRTSLGFPTLTAYDRAVGRLADRLRQSGVPLPKYPRRTHWQEIAERLPAVGNRLIDPGHDPPAPDLRAAYDAAQVESILDGIAFGRMPRYSARLSHSVSNRVSNALTPALLVVLVNAAKQAEDLYEAKWPIHLADGALFRLLRNLDSPTRLDRDAQRRDVVAALDELLARWKRSDPADAPDTTLAELGRFESFAGRNEDGQDLAAHSLVAALLDPEILDREATWAYTSYYDGPLESLLTAYEHLGRLEDNGHLYVANEILVMGRYWMAAERQGLDAHSLFAPWERENMLETFVTISARLGQQNVTVKRLFERSVDPLIREIRLEVE